MLANTVRNILIVIKGLKFKLKSGNLSWSVRDSGFKIMTRGNQDAHGVTAVALQEWMEKMAAVEQVRSKSPDVPAGSEHPWLSELQV